MYAWDIYNVYKLIRTSIKGQNKSLLFFIYQLFTLQVSSFLLYSFLGSKLSLCKFQIKPIQKFQIFGDMIVMLVEFTPK